jgi:hypothetical protein
VKEREQKMRFDNKSPKKSRWKSLGKTKEEAE